MNKINNRIFQILCGLMLLVSTSAFAVDLNKENRDPKYVEVILRRSQKVVDKLGITDKDVAQNVCYIIANRYFELNDIYAKRDAELKKIKNSGLTGNTKKEALSSAKYEADAALYRSHFAFPANLSLYLNDKQIEAVKDRITYGVVMVTYTATLEMIPTLTNEEKAQIYAWLVEAREFAMDAESSSKKHAAFGKYKGRINNYLSKRGYDLVKERKQWYKRIADKKAKENKAK